MKIVIPDFIDMSESAFLEVEELEATVYNDTPDSEAEIINRIKDAEIITANYIDITPKIIDSAPKLKHIIVPASGYEWVDHEYAASKGIKVLNCPTQNVHAVAEFAFALMFAVARKVVESKIDLSEGNWQQNIYRGIELSGKKLGIIGYGKIGKDIEKIGKGLGMVTAHANSKTPPQDLDNILSDSDFICLSLLLNDSTRNLIDARRLSLLKDTAIFINVARGATVDQAALLTLLRENKIFGAGLDVFVDEPLVGKPSQEIIDLANLPNVVATPHIGYNSKETAERLGSELVDNIKSCIKGEPINVVN